MKCDLHIPRASYACFQSNSDPTTTLPNLQTFECMDEPLRWGYFENPFMRIGFVNELKMAITQSPLIGVRTGVVLWSDERGGQLL